MLLDALRDREAHVRWDAARALGQIGAAAAEGLAAAVNDKDPVVRQIAADALKRIIQRKRESHVGRTEPPVAESARSGARPSLGQQPRGGEGKREARLVVK